MTGLEMVPRGYRISVRPIEGETGIYRVSYSPRGLQQPREVNGEFPQAPRDFVAVVQLQDDGMQVRWENFPKGDRDSTLADYEEDARGRVRLLRE